MRKVYVTKASGKLEKFNINKIIRTCVKAGAPRDVAKRIAKEVMKKLYNGISTREILNITLNLLEKEMPHVAAKYDLKRSIMSLGPAGFIFEKLFAEILRSYGYSARVHSILQGHCIKHEIDIIAAKPIKIRVEQPNLRWYMIECKYHNSPGIFTGSKDIMYTYTRFLDLMEGWKEGKCQKFDQPWLVTNTKFSKDAIQFGICKNIKLTGWKYPTGNGIEDMIEKKKLYPVTILRSLDRFSLQKLSDSGLMFIRDLFKYDLRRLNKKTKIPLKRLRILINEAEKISGD